MKRSYPGEAEKRRDKKECGQTPQILLLLVTQTPRLLVNTVSVAAAPIQRTSFTSLPSPAPENNNVPVSVAHEQHNTDTNNTQTVLMNDDPAF